ncbi:MAG: ATP-binding protein [Spirochaetes bacterium]|nr:ATP-binding protein [Spirochaetota bacterium]
MQFERPITLIQLLIPAICTGMLLIGLTISLYLSARYRSKLYATMGFLCLCAFVFVANEMLILSVGGFCKNWQLSVHFHQTEQIAGAFFVFGVPYILGQMLELKGTQLKINNIISTAGLVFAMLCLFSVFFFPDAFISSQMRKATWMINEADFGRGSEGILYFIRDGILSICSFYAFFSIANIIHKRKHASYLIYPLTGMLVAIIGGAIDSLFVYRGINYDIFPDEYFSRFSIGITFFALSVIAGLIVHYVNVAKEVEAAHHVITVSEKKYKLLVERTNDLIFTVNKNFAFASSNYAAQKGLKLSDSDFASMKFFDIIYADKASNIIEFQMMKNRLIKSAEAGKPITFNCYLYSKQTLPKEYSLRFEPVDIDGEKEIIIKASPIPENKTARYLEEESRMYIIGSDFSAAEDISKTLVENLSKHMTSYEITNLRIGLHDMILNAIEHGNHGISDEEKNETAVKSDHIGEKQSAQEHSSKKVKIKMHLLPEKAVFEIEDEGKGLDHKRILDSIKEKSQNTGEAHEKELVLTRGIFDEINYNRKGNKVSLVKKFNSSMH